MQLAEALRANFPGMPGVHSNRVLPIKQHLKGRSKLVKYKMKCANCGDSAELMEQHGRNPYMVKGELCQACNAWKHHDGEGKMRPPIMWPFYLREHLGVPQYYNCHDTDPTHIKLRTEYLSLDYEESCICHLCDSSQQHFKAKQVGDEIKREAM